MSYRQARRYAEVVEAEGSEELMAIYVSIKV